MGAQATEGNNMSYKPLIVEKLIEELKKFPKNKEVILEGCDCWGDAISVREVTEPDGDKVLIEREK